MKFDSQQTTSSDLAIKIAVLIDRDPVMAAQIKNHISEARLIECLDLKKPAQDLAEQAIIQDPEPLAELKETAKK